MKKSKNETDLEEDMVVGVDFGRMEYEGSSDTPKMGAEATKTASSVTKEGLIEALEEAIATAKAAALNPVAYKRWEEIVARAKG